MEIATIIIILTIVALFSYSYFFKEKRKNVNNFPSPPARFFVGHILDIGSTTKILSTCTKYLEKYGSIVRLKAGPYYDVLLTDNYKFMEFILGKTKGLAKSENYKFLGSWLGSGLLLSEGTQWKHNRKMLTPAFHFEILKNFVNVFESVGNVLIEKLKECNDPNSVDLWPLMTLCTLDMICETAMGTKINAQSGENSKYVNSVQELSRIFVTRTFSVLKLKNWSFVLTGDYYLQRKLVKILHDFTFGVMADKKAKEAGGQEDERKKKMAFLDLLKNFRGVNGQKLSDEQIRQEVDTFMFAGHDTTATALCFTLFCIANHPDIQEKILLEQADLFGNEKNPQVTYQDLQNMRYLEKVIKESLRLFPPVSVIGRFTTEELEFGNHIIAKNTNLVLFIYGLHRNPKYFSNPEKFDPDRFDSVDGSSPFAFIPFSAGQRNCIGQKFALLEMKSTISKVVRNFELKPAYPKHELQVAMEIVLKSLNGIKIGLERRI